MKHYQKHQHLKLSDLSLHPKQFLHIVSMLSNGQSYPNIQRYIQRTLKTDILKSTISNLKKKVILARNLQVPITSLLDGRRNPRSLSRKKNKDRVTVLDCINGLIRSYYADVRSQTLTDRQRQAFIEVLKLKLKYNNEIKDEVLDTGILTNALEVDTLWKNKLFELLWKVDKQHKDLDKVFGKELGKTFKHIKACHSVHDLAIMKKYCQRHNIWWTDDIYFNEP